LSIQLKFFNEGKGKRQSCRCPRGEGVYRDWRYGCSLILDVEEWLTYRFGC